MSQYSWDIQDDLFPLMLALHIWQEVLTPRSFRLNSVEVGDSQSSSDLPRFDHPTNSESSSLPPHIPSYLQSQTSISAFDYVSSAASSPSAAYAGLSIDGERGGEPTGEQRRVSLAPNEQDTRSQSPLNLFTHRAIMGGAEDLPQRASSPLKRRASDLEAEVPSSQREDVDMIPVPPSDPPEPSTQTSRTKRAQSIDMLRNEGDADTSNGSSEEQNSSTPATTTNAEADIPPIDAQIKTATTMCKAAAEQQLKEGDKVYLVSRKWLHRVTSRGSEAMQNSKVKPEGDIGPVDNSDIIQQIIKDSNGHDFVQLKHGLGTEAFELFPQDAWNLIVEWYGLMPGSMPIERFAHNTNPDKSDGATPNVLYEFHPPIFTVHRLWAEHSPINISQKLKASQPAAPIFVVSRNTKYHTFLRQTKEKAEIDLSKKVRIWRVPRIQPAAEPLPTPINTSTPPSSRPGSPAANIMANSQSRQPQDSWTKLLLDVPSFTQLERGNGRELVPVDDHTANAKYNGSMDVSMAGLGDDQTIVLDENISNDSWISNTVSKGAKSSASTALARTGVSNSQPNSGRNSPAPSGPMTRGRAQKAGRTLGTVGLSNLGNTCYMNSALQCVRSVEELTKYFLTGAAKNELNAENPLGNNGEIAMAYERLLEEIYKDPVPTSVAPRYFKTTIGRYAPSFSGYGQQDSQEFLGFLLDGLQEDLSRIKKKPYIEKPDSTDEMVTNPEAIREMAAKVWDITKRRDDSVIADLFTGMYKSTLVCPVCAKVSITFDPFNNLTLQLPIENSWSHNIFFFPLNDKPILISVDMDKQGSISAMKQYISKKVDVPVERLFVAEEFKCKFYKIFDDLSTASDEISQNDNVAVYELEAKPTNWPAPQKPKKQKKSSMLLTYSNDSEEDDVPNWDDPLAEKMLVPIFHRRPNPERGNRFKKPWMMTPVPHFIIVTPEEARNEEMIKRKILEKIATFSTSPEFDEGDGSVSESVDPDVVITTGSDADSSGGNKVAASSVDGDDELVDVTMKDSNGVRDSIEIDAESSEPSQAAKIPRHAPFNKRRPEFITPGSYLNPALQNMFELGYFSGIKEMVPSGWNAVDEDKTYPTLDSRNPQVRQPRDLDLENGYDQNSQDGSETSQDNDNFHDSAFSSTTRMVEEESDEDELAGPVRRALPVRPAGPKSGVRVGLKQRNRRMKTYSRKGQQARKFTNIVNNDDQDTPEEGPLVRLGEGIVVDWNPRAFDSMFGAENADDNMRGRDTYTAIPTFDDPELTAKRSARALRRRNGITLDDCLNEFGKEEILSEMDTWYCPRCKEHRRASKKFELWKTPDILVMHLKRFSSSALRRDKLDVMVEFPIEGLDLTSRVVETEDGKQEIYDLFAVDDHWGGLGGGHYTAFAKNFVDHEWYEYNDSSVSKVKDPSRVVSQSAYLLFYRRRSDGPLGGPRFKQILHDWDNPPEPSEDEVSESGEDQGLVGNSSLRGSSSALTGVGAAHHHQNRGGDGVEMMTVNPSALEQLPSYEAHEENPDAAPTFVGDALMNDGLPLQNSIEDEGIGMESGNYNVHYNPLHNAGWDFSNIGRNSRGSHMISGTGSDIDNASAIVQNDSSATEGSVLGRLEDFDNAIPEDDDGVFVDQSPVPDLDDEGQASAIALQHDLLEAQNRGMYPRQFEVPAGDEDEVEEPATEIHIGDGEELKMD